MISFEFGLPMQFVYFRSFELNFVFKGPTIALCSGLDCTFGCRPLLSYHSASFTLSLPKIKCASMIKLLNQKKGIGIDFHKQYKTIELKK